MVGWVRRRMKDGGGDSSRDLGNSGGKRKSNSDRQVSMND